MNKAHALVSLRPDAQWVIRGEEIEWLDSEQTQPSDEEIQAEIIRLQAEYVATEYQRLRAAAYPSLTEQLDMQYWDSINGTTVWADTIAAIKAKYPKP